MSDSIAQGDIKLLSTENGGEVTINDGIMEMTGGFETMAYLALFGGNEEDNATESTKRQEWWGNKIEPDPDKYMRSRFQNLVRGLPATLSNLRRLEVAALDDLKVFTDTGIADEIIVNLRIPQKNRLKVEAKAIKDQTKIFEIQFEQNWLAQINN